MKTNITPMLDLIGIFLAASFVGWIVVQIIVKWQFGTLVPR